jgi:hypothetical protein
MRKKVVSFALLISVISFGSVNPVFADSVYAKGDRVLLADDDLYIYDTSKYDEYLEKITIGNATDVTVSECKAIVTTDDGFAKGIFVVNLTNNENLLNFCSGDGESNEGNNEDRCKATYDPRESALTIPCVEAFGGMYTVQMKQRGNSENWYVSFIE